METKYFTIEQANALIPFIDQEIVTLQLLKKQFSQKMLQLKKMKTSAHIPKDLTSDDPFFALETEIEFIQIEAKSHIQMLYNKGIELKDIDLGLVDFPSRIEGENVLLCWKQGETEIRYYHSRESGYAGRKPLYE